MELHQVVTALQEAAEQRAGAGGLASDKFVSSEFRSADAKHTALGLEIPLGISQEELGERKARGVEAIRDEIEEHGTDDDRECFEYVMHQVRSPRTPSLPWPSVAFHDLISPLSDLV